MTKSPKTQLFRRSRTSIKVKVPENNLHISVKYFVLTKDKERMPLCKATFITIFGDYEKEKKRENHAQYLINKQNVGFFFNFIR